MPHKSLRTDNSGDWNRVCNLIVREFKSELTQGDLAKVDKGADVFPGPVPS
jgi:hypothetical protein